MFTPRLRQKPVVLHYSVCHTCNVKDRSDYDKAVLLTLPVQREAEVVALFHATAHHRQHNFLYMLDGANFIAPQHTVCFICFLKRKDRFDA